MASNNPVVISCNEEFTSPVAAVRLFRALIIDGDRLIPNLLPQAIKSIEVLEGHGGPGTIKNMTIAQGNETKIVKQRVDEIDEVNFKYAYTVIEGGALSNKIESISHEIKFEAASDGGTKGRNVSHYRPKPGANITEQEVRAEEAKAKAIFKLVELYLQANPDAYA